ncbi:MAG: hypothetical protein O3B35_03975 [Proteobacteria bacterium]|nr:hypothetical protein [Pseudomonadota bacterium]
MMVSKLGILLLVACLSSCANFEEYSDPSDVPFPSDRLILVSQGIDNNGNTTCTYRKGARELTIVLGPGVFCPTYY